MRFQEIIDGLLAGGCYRRTEADGRVRKIWLSEGHILATYSDEICIEEYGDTIYSPTRGDLQADDWEEVRA